MLSSQQSTRHVNRFARHTFNVVVDLNTDTSTSTTVICDLKSILQLLKLIATNVHTTLIKL